MYRRSLISFIDILGFKSLIATASYAEVSEKLDEVKRLSGWNSVEDGDGLEPRVIQFSDSIIRIRPIDGKANNEFPYGMLFHELYDLVFMQGELVKHGVCLRGGIAIGEVHYDERSAFGPGFVRAYEMESQFANYPRIVLDPQVLRDLLAEPKLIAKHHDVQEEASHIRKLVRKDADGMYFVDYLNVFVNELDEPEFQPAFLADHKKLVLGGVRESQTLCSVTAKYLWLATYHNDLVRRLPAKWLKEHGLKHEDIAISQKELPTNFEWPT